MATITLEERISQIENILTRPDFRGTSKQLFNTRLAERLYGRNEVSGAELMVISLEALAPENPGIWNMAGHHGGAILPFFEYFTKSPLITGYDHVLHEQMAGHMAEGIASLGHVGVALATSGPGATNSITPFFDAYMDSKAVVFITGNVPTKVAGTMAFQEAPITQMVDSIDKGIFYIRRAEDIPRAFYDAFALAISERPGPVWIDVAKDAQMTKIKPEQIDYDFKTPHSTNGSLSDIIKNLSILAGKVRESRRPVLYVGGGAKLAWQELRNFVNLTGIPVTTTLKGKGIFPEEDPLSLGMLGMHGTAYANQAVDLADLVMCVGARFDDRVRGNTEAFAHNAWIAHIDIDPRGIGPTMDGTIRQPDLIIKCDTKKALKALNLLVTERPCLKDWHDKIAQRKKEFPLDYDGRSDLQRQLSLVARIIDYARSMRPFSYCMTSDVIKPQYVIEKIYQLTGGKHLVVADVGQHQMWAAQKYLASQHDGFDTSGGSGTMGYSLAAALGVYKMLAYENSSKPVSVIVGDESFWMLPHTLKLYRRKRANIKVFVIDNKAENGTPGGMVRQWYDTVHHGTQLSVSDDVPIVNIARACRIPSEEVHFIDQVERSIKRALDTKGPYVVCFKVDPDENCLPMIPSGGTVKDMVTYQGAKRLSKR